MAEFTPEQVTAYLDDVAKRYHVFGESDAMPHLLAAVEAALKLGDRSADPADPSLPGHVDRAMIWQTVSRALLGGEPGA